MDQDCILTATTDVATARQLQEIIIASNSEAAFFPHISALVEGLSDEQFR